MNSSKLKRWLIPQGWQDLYIKHINNKRRNTFNNISLEKYRGIHRGERCFILASGPSINNQDLTLLKGEVSIAVSQFFLHEDINIIKPSYHCFAPQHSPFDNNTNKIIFDNYVSNYTFPVVAFIGDTNYEYSYKNFLKNNLNYKIHAEFVSFDNAEQINETNFSDNSIWDISNRPFSLRTVIYFAIQLAYFMGFKEIYLLGVDHDYLSDINRVENHHFYKETRSFSDKEHLGKFSKENWFEEYYNRWKQYRLMKEFLLANGVKVFNATEGGMLDVFPRVNYNSLFI